MYALKPKAVFAHRRVYDNPEAVERMERILGALAIDRKDVETVDLADVDRIVAISGATDEITAEKVLSSNRGRVRQGQFKPTEDPVLVFNTFVWDDDRRLDVPNRPSNLQARRLVDAFCGIGAAHAFSRRELLTPDRECICQGGWGIHTTSGCAHKCAYCEEGWITNLFLDIEDFCQELPRMFQRRPEQMLYRYDLYSDILAFEPEYGACERVGRCFAEHGKYVLLYTRSDNVGWLGYVPDDQKPYMPINWTISMDTQARLFEGDSPPLVDRIEAMRFCQDNGYVVRAGFSPVIPVRDWRRETTEMLQQLFAKVRPEVLRVWVLAMIDAAELDKMLDVEAIDPEFVRRMREAANELNGTFHAPFPTDVRLEIYNHYIDQLQAISPETPLALCSEHADIWDRLEHRLAMTRGSMFCCCGGLSVPGTYGPPE